MKERKFEVIVAAQHSFRVYTVKAQEYTAGSLGLQFSSNGKEVARFISWIGLIDADANLTGE